MNVAFCTAPKEDQDSLDCYAIAHLPCLAKHYLSDPSSEGTAVSVLPHSGRCPDCKTRTDWGQVIRAIYARRDGEKEDDQLAEKTRLRDMKAAELADKRRLAELAREGEKVAKRRKAEEAREEKRRLKEVEKAQKPKGKRRAKSKALDSSDSDEY